LNKRAKKPFKKCLELIQSSKILRTIKISFKTHINILKTLLTQQNLFENDRIIFMKSIKKSDLIWETLSFTLFEILVRIIKKMNVLEEEKSYELPTCSICMEDLADSLSTTNCGHVFHTVWFKISCHIFNIKNSVMQSLEHKGTCPLCRVRTTKGNLKELNYTVGGIYFIDSSNFKFEELKRID